MTRIEFLIDELVLIGFDPRDRNAVASATQRGLIDNAISEGWRASTELGRSSRWGRLARGGDDRQVSTLASRIGEAIEHAVVAARRRSNGS